MSMTLYVRIFLKLGRKKMVFYEDKYMKFEKEQKVWEGMFLS